MRKERKTTMIYRYEDFILKQAIEIVKNDKCSKDCQLEKCDDRCGYYILMQNARESMATEDEE